jgi:predicted CXXCH cytochrome family protein
VLSDVGPKRFDAETMIPTVTCERCHGPARAHVEAARRGETSLAMPFGAGRETAELEMKLCGHCHRLPEMAPPGAVRVDNHELARFQPVGLMQSACWKGTKGELRCTTCHDPHTRTSNDLVRYENGCLRCHDAAPERICSISPTPKSGCVGCHMPKRDAGQGILFTDHWIRIP